MMITEPSQNQSLNWRHAFAALPAVGIFLWLRIPLLGEIICDTDVAGILYSGWGMADGLLPYKDIFETKPPGTYFLFALMIKIFGLQITPINVLGIIWALAALVGVFFLTSRLAGPVAGVIAGWAYSLASSSDYINGICPNYETWTLAPGIFGLLVFSYAMKSSRPAVLTLCAGALFGLSMSMKFQGLFFALAACGGMLFYLRPISTASLPRIMKTGLLLAGGAVAVYFLYFLYYAANGAAGEFIAAVSPGQGASYAKARTITLVSSEYIKNMAGFFSDMPVLLSGVGFAVLITPLALKKKLIDIQHGALLFSWMAFTFFAAFFLKGLLADGQFYPHYLVIALPGLCGVFGFAVSLLFRVPKAGWIGWPLAVLLLIPMAIGLGREFDLASSCRTSIARDGSPMDKFILTEYKEMEFVYGMRTTHHLSEIAGYLREKTTPDQPIFIWDSLSAIYILAQRRSPTYYYKPYYSSVNLPWSVHKEGDVALEEIRVQIIRELSAHPPAFVVHLTQPRAEYPHKEPLFPALERFLNEKYKKAGTMSDGAFTIWKLSEPEKSQDNGEVDQDI